MLINTTPAPDYLTFCQILQDQFCLMYLYHEFLIEPVTSTQELYFKAVPLGCY